MGNKLLFLAACAAACLAFTGPRHAVAAPVITKVKNGIQKVPFIPQPSADTVLADYPFLGPIIDKLGGADPGQPGRLFWTAYVKDVDLKANFLFVYVEGVKQCKQDVCPLYALVNEGKGFNGYTTLSARPPIRLLKLKDRFSLLMNDGQDDKEWPFANHAFLHGYAYTPGLEGIVPFNTELPAQEPSPVQEPVQKEKKK